MADIFVSYARVDKARVAPLVAALEARGWSVWWDPEIAPGQEFDRQIARELDAAKAVIVVWTPMSVDSRWVRGEARLAADRGVLVPVRFEHARLPIDALALHTTDLDDWQEDSQGAAFQQLSRALGPLLTSTTGGTSSIGGASSASAWETARERKGRSICVLPFVNMSGDAEQEYFSDGISEDIITDLSKVSALLVIARNTAFTFKGKPVDVKGVARQLDVSHVLEGSVRKSGSRVRITAQLIDGQSGGHVWAERYDRDLSDIFALQDEISQAIVAALKMRLFPEEKRAIEDRGTQSVEAYDKYLRARPFTVSQHVQRAVDLYREVLALDPQFVQGWVGLSEALRISMIFFPQTAKAAQEEMRHALERVDALAPNTAMSYAMRGTERLLHYDWPGAEQSYAKAVELAKSNEAPFRAYGLVLSILGRHREALVAARAALRVDPLALFASFYLQWQLDLAGRDEEAEAEYARSKDLPGDRAAIEWRAMTRMWARRDDARAKQRLIAAFGHDTTFMPCHPQLAQVLDEPEKALAIIHAAFDDPRYQDGSRLGTLAHWAERYGDRDLAFRALRRGYVEMHGQTVIDIWMPVFAELRRDPRFKALVRDLGLYDYWRKSGKWGEHARPVGDDDFEVW